MDSTLLVSTPLLGLERLGGLSERSHAALTLALGQLGENHRRLLAEPVPGADGARIDWYVEGTDRPVRVSELAAEEQAEILAKLSVLSADVAAEADRLQGKEPALAQALRNALVVPDENHVYAVDGEPVLVAWAYRRIGLPGYGGPPSAIIAAAQPATVPPPPPLVSVAQTLPPRRGRGLLTWLLWLLFMAIVGYIYWLSLNACGLKTPVWGIDFCPASQGALSSAEAEKAEQIAARIRQAEAALEAARAVCEACQALPLPIPLAPSPEPEPEPPQDDIQDRLDDAGAQTGDTQVTLVWDGRADLDLVIDCPEGRIWFRNTQACGGTLDVDMNSSRGRGSSRPIENVFFVDGQTPAGPYRVGVMLYERRGDRRPEIPFSVRIKTGTDVVTKDGKVSRERELVPVHNFSR